MCAPGRVSSSVSPVTIPFSVYLIIFSGIVVVVSFLIVSFFCVWANMITGVVSVNKRKIIL